MIIFKTKKDIILLLLRFQFSQKSLKINGFKHPVPFGIEIAHQTMSVKFVDKAKPRAIVGQKAMSSSGRAGLAKQEEFCRYVIYKRGKKMIVYDIKLYDSRTDTTTIVLTLIDRRQDYNRPRGRVTIEKWVKSLLGEEWWLKNWHNISITQRIYEETERGRRISSKREVRSNSPEIH